MGKRWTLRDGPYLLKLMLVVPFYLEMDIS